MDAHIISFGPFRLFERQLRKGNEPVPLGGRALDTLVALVQRAGEIVTQRELISSVWPDVRVEEANLRVHIASIRKALGDGRQGGARYIMTVPGRGYSFVAPVTLSSRPSSPSTEAAVFDRPQGLPPKLIRIIGHDDTIRTISAQLMMLLSPPVAEYVEGTNSFDLERLVAPFAEDALVNDQLRNHWGKPAIREWAARDIIGTSLTMEVKTVVEHYGNIIVTANVTGKFDMTGLPDPFVHFFYFTIHGDRIVQLIILRNRYDI